MPTTAARTAIRTSYRTVVRTAPRPCRRQFPCRRPRRCRPTSRAEAADRTGGRAGPLAGPRAEPARHRAPAALGEAAALEALVLVAPLGVPPPFRPSRSERAPLTEPVSTCISTTPDATKEPDHVLQCNQRGDDLHRLQPRPDRLVLRDLRGPAGVPGHRLSADLLGDQSGRLALGADAAGHLGGGDARDRGAGPWPLRDRLDAR